MAFATIRGNFDAMWAKFPMRPNLPNEITDYIAALKKATPGSNPTECCLQLSWALNAAGLTVPRNSYRRLNADLGRGGWGLGACDEVEIYLTTRYGKTEDIKQGRTVPELREYIRGRQGILAFRDSTPGQHVELWDYQNIRQRGGAPGGMSEGFIFGQPRILFWEVANTLSADAFVVPQWLRGWWYVTEGKDYWYYFSDQGTVSYVERAPKSLFQGPVGMPENTGRVTVRDERPQVVIEWNAAGDGVTVEKFTVSAVSGSPKAMSGVSNRFGSLNASKLS
jgi:Type VI secretion system (T6SS), amidase effector protein 4